MCCNVMGLGALNVYWTISGLIWFILNVLPMSTDCDQGMQAWLGVTHECTSIEEFLNLQWCVSVAFAGVTVAVLGILPKLVSDYPASANKAVMLAVSAVNTAFMVLMLIMALTMTVEAEGQTSSLMSSFGVLPAAQIVLLFVALIVHREPANGEAVMAMR